MPKPISPQQHATLRLQLRHLGRHEPRVWRALARLANWFYRHPVSRRKGGR